MTNRTNDLTTNRKNYDRSTNNFQLFRSTNRNDDRLNQKFDLCDDNRLRQKQLYDNDMVSGIQEIWN